MSLLVELSLMKSIFLILFILFLVLSFFLLLKIMSSLRKLQVPVKGLLKFLTFENNRFSSEQKKYIWWWFLSFTILITLPWGYMLVYWLNSDSSFFVALYPLLWLYLFNRVIVFEASDYIEEKKPKE